MKNKTPKNSAGVRTLDYWSSIGKCPNHCATALATTPLATHLPYFSILGQAKLITCFSVIHEKSDFHVGGRPFSLFIIKENTPNQAVCYYKG